MKYNNNNSSSNKDKNKDTRNSRTSFSREFAIRYDEVEKLTEQMYSR
jgi:hypothetical protein